MRSVAPASPGYWALDAYRVALAGDPSQLGRPLAMLGVFALVGVAAAMIIGARQRARPATARTLRSVPAAGQG
jgi:hypothetical protein